MGVDLHELRTFVFPSEVIDVVLLVVGLHLVQASKDLARVDRAWIAFEHTVSTFPSQYLQVLAYSRFV